MSHRVSLAVSFHPLVDDDDDGHASTDTHSTPRSSFLSFLDSPDSQCDDDLGARPNSLLSVDSGYFSIMDNDSPASKPFSRETSAADLRHPLLPINGPADATQGFLRREGTFRNLLRKRKKHMSSPCPPDRDPFTPADDQVVQVHPRSISLPLPRSGPRNPSIDAFEQQDRFVLRQGMKHHPYPRDDAPYMLAYNRILLDNDRCSESLLRRLNQHHSPSFLDFAHTPPKTILDLGCGPGGWAVEAAVFWPSSQVIGFDLLDPVRLRGGVESPSNVQWKQGNFVKYKLPFPKNMFDLVRMANLSLCIPNERWEHVLSEVRRVLAQGGRLELIDDYLHFPYTKHPPRPPTHSHSTPGTRPSSASFGHVADDGPKGTVTEQQGGGGGGSPNEHANGVLDDVDDDDDDDDDDDFFSTKSRFSTQMNADDFLSLSAYDPVTEWDRNANNSKCLEKLFEDMLSRKFSIHPRPSKFLDNIIDKVFGRYNQCRLHEFNLYLAPPSGQDSDSSSIGSSDGPSSASLRKAGKDFAKWVKSVDWDHKEREKRPRSRGDRSSGESILSLSMVPGMISPKAAGRLGIKPTPPRSSHPAQSPGLILWPSTFIPIPPSELEMHACKHLHSLIGCKAALFEFLQDVALEQNLPFERQMADDLIWDYESFRRKRFNWPSECSDIPLDVSLPLTTTPRSALFLNSLESSPQVHPSTGPRSISPPSDPLFSREQLDFVRSIRVYSATKNDEEIHVS